MNNAQLVDAVAKSTGQPKANVKAVMDDMLMHIADDLKAGNEVALHGFGKFKVRTRKATVGRNPKTGEALNIPETKSAAFSASKVLKDKL